MNATTHHQASGERVGALIDGAVVEGTETLPVIDPSDGVLIGSVDCCGAAEIDAAVEAASRAGSEWAGRPTAERSRILDRLADLIRRDRAALASLECADTGKPLRQAEIDIDLCARYFEYYAHTVEAFFGDTVPIASDLHVYTLREPHGVTANIIPWNYPAQITGRTIAAALAVGNSCVLKPAEQAPLTPWRVGQLALEAGVPPGVFNIVNGRGADAGAMLVSHRAVEHISFTGSVDVGRAVGRTAADNVVPVTLELGGKSPNIVFEDARLDLAVPAIVNSILQNAGQTCSAGSRLLVERSIHAAVVDAIRERFRQVRVGPGRENPDLGPLISEAQLDRVQRLVDVGRSEARLLEGGGRLDTGGLESGFFFAPTLFDDVPPDAVIATEEVFGPVLSVTPFDTEAEAVELANASDFGLIAAVWTGDVSRVHRVARALQVGQVFVNTYGAAGGVELAFGGVKRSGFGREKGFEALAGFTRSKTVAVKVEQ